MKCLMAAWDESEPLLYGWLLKQTKNKHETEDIMQEVFLKAMHNSQRFCTLDDGRSWLFKITKNQLIDSLRRKIHVDDIATFKTTDNTSPVMTQLQSCLPRVLTELTDTDRDIIEQCDLNGMTQIEFAKRHHLSLPATKARLRRAREKLKEILVDKCNVQRDQTGVCGFKRYHI